MVVSLYFLILLKLSNGLYTIFEGASDTCNSAITTNKFCGHVLNTDFTSASLISIPICGNRNKYEYLIKLELNDILFFDYKLVK